MSNPSQSAVGVPWATATTLSQDSQLSRDSQQALSGLVGRVAQRDQSAFVALYGLLSGEIDDRVGAQLSDPRQRAALVQATLVELWRLASAHADCLDPWTWVHAIAAARTRELLRREEIPWRDPWWAGFEAVHDCCRRLQFYALAGDLR